MTRPVFYDYAAFSAFNVPMLVVVFSILLFAGLTLFPRTRIDK